MASKVAMGVISSKTKKNIIIIAVMGIRGRRRRHNINSSIDEEIY